MTSNPSIFRAYDIRGIYPNEINEKIAYQIGKAFAVYLKENEELISNKIVVGEDTRLSSPILARSFIGGIIDSGINVWDIGVVSVDAVYFASGKYHLPAAMITASHNPKEWNGFKLMKSDVGFFPVKDLEIIINSSIRQKAEMLEVLEARFPTKGEVTIEDIKNDYLKHVFSFINIDTIRPMRIVVDASSDAVNLTLKSVLGRLPIDYVMRKDINDLKNEINFGHYHFGCSFDTDGDRVLFSDEYGEMVSPSIIGAIIVKYFLKWRRNEKVVYGADVSKIIPDVVSAYGGDPIREKVGHTYVSGRLKEIGGIIGVESSGHYYLRNNFYADSGIISFLILIEILSGHKKRLSTLSAEFSKYFSAPILNFRVENQEELIKKIAQNFEGYEIDWLDGLTVTTSDFWFNLRPSNTEPLVRLTVEARNESILERVKKDLTILIRSYLSK